MYQINLNLFCFFTSVVFQKFVLKIENIKYATASKTKKIKKIFAFWCP